MDQNPARCKHSKHTARRVSIVGYTCSTSKNADCTNSLKCSRMYFVNKWIYISNNCNEYIDTTKIKIWNNNSSESFYPRYLSRFTPDINTI